MIWLVCVSLYLSFGPTQAPFYTPSLYDNARLLELFTLCVLSLIALLTSSLRQGIARMLLEARGSIRLALFTLMALAVLSALRAGVPTMAFQEVALLALLGMLALSVVSTAMANRRAVDISLLVALEGSVLIFIVVFWMAQAATTQLHRPFEWIHPFISFANVRHFSQFQAYTLPMLVVPMALNCLRLRWRVVAFLVAAHWWALQFAVGTRAIWFAGALSAAILFLVLRRDAVAYLKWLGFAVLGGGILYMARDSFFLSDAPGLGEMGRRGFDSSNRGDLWLSALGMVRDAPVLGVGPMHFSFRNFDWAAHPHNSVLQFAAEFGLPAATIAIALFTHLLWRCVGWTKKATSGADRMLNAGLLTALFMGLLDSLVSGNTLMPVPQIMLFVLIGWVVGRNVSGLSDTPRIPGRRAELALSALCLASVVVVAGGALAYYRYWDVRQFSIPAGPSHPRYWEEGHWPTAKPAGIPRR
jgi:putative inorganic carbon (HCO3(-)) transporter